jgi:hypothetical protein
MQNTVSTLLKNHTDSNNSNDYTPRFINASPNVSANVTGNGYYTDTWYGIHNPSGSARTVKIWTVDQGYPVGGAGGASVRINAGETFYTTLARVEVGSGVTVVLLGIQTNFSR